ncbi:MAG: alpha/beta hydrolase [Chloroflexota bacterium]|nr:alpha/beta hydrolase [Chloroflexota bacterium]MDE2885554.1 alpha/beta hydrolase [Chloroflexota bacterium]
MTTSATEHTVNAHGLDLHYLDWGNADAPPVLLLHGLQDSAALWSTFAESMRDDFHVMALDHRGHGDSPRAETYALADYIAETRDVIRNLGLDAPVLIGHSAGSKNAWMCIADNPGIASKLVITDMDPDSYNPGSVAMISRYKDETDFYADRSAVVERLRSRQPNASDEELERDVDALAVQLDDGRYTWKRSRDVVTKYDRPDVWERLPEVSAPTLVVRGAESTLLRHDVAVRMEAAIPDCRLIELPGGGHWVHLEQPDAYAAAVRSFLLG